MKKAFLALAIAIALAGGVRADHDRDGKHDSDRFEFKPGTLVLSRSVYTAPKTIVTPGDVLPPGCVPDTTLSVTCGVAASDGEYPNLTNTNNVWNNDGPDGSFGVTSPIFLDNITPNGHFIDTLPVPTDLLVTSFSSKSELALNRSVNGKSITFMGYIGPVNTLDVSNSNTPGVVDPSNPVVSQHYRAVAEVDHDGRIRVTETNAYSGNNGRAAIKADWLYYAVGNSSNGSTNPTSVTSSTGVELIVPHQAPGVPQQIGTLQFGTDKPGKDTNFRGTTVFGNTLYVTKGSGSNGVNTVYRVGDMGSLPTTQNEPPLPAPPSLLNFTFTILPGFPSYPADIAKNNPNARYPFGIWFADANTLYVADEGDGCTSNSKTCPNILKKDTTACTITCSVYANAAAQTKAGLEKWVLDSTGTWNLVYTLQAGLNLGVPYTVPDYPTGVNASTGLHMTPATDGLRNLTGRVNRDGTVTIWAVTSTVSGNGDQGADPNFLVKVTDVLKATTLPTGDGDHDRDDSWETFVTIRAAKAGEVLRGIAFAPSERDGDGDDHDDGNHDWH